MKARLILLAALLALLLAACGSPRTGENAPEELSPGSAAAELPSLPFLSREQSQAMAMVVNANRALPGDGVLFCYDFDKDWQPVLARYRWKNGVLDQFTVLAKGCVPEYLCRHGGWLYYIDRNSGALERVPESGGERQLLHEGPCSWLCLQEKKLYFCDRRGRYLCLDPKTQEETLVLEGPCAFAYPLEGLILWQDTDEQGIFLTDRETGATRHLSRGPTGVPLVLEDRIWFYSSGAVHSLNPEGGDARFFVLPETDGAVELLPEKGGLRLRGIREPNGPVQWEGLTHGPFRYEPRGYRICDWLRDELRVETIYEPDGRIRCYLLQDAKGRELRFLAGKVEKTEKGAG